MAGTLAQESMPPKTYSKPYSSKKSENNSIPIGMFRNFSLSKVKGSFQDNLINVLVFQGVFAFQAEQSKPNAASRLSQLMETATSTDILFCKHFFSCP
jgi:hypothetical protein